MTRSPWQLALARFRLRRSGALRALAYALLCATLVLVWGIHSVKAMVAEKALALGNEMLKLDVVDGEINRVDINGERFRVSIATVDNPVDEVLTRFESMCNLGGSVAADAWRSVAELDDTGADAGLERGAPARRRLRRGVVLSETGRRGAGSLA
jgi:hypothetical protein